MSDWDGSFLGNYTEEEAKIQGDHCIINGVRYYIKHKKDTIYCIIDEIKPLFGIKKIGTHRLNIGNKAFVIYNLELPDKINTVYSYDYKKFTPKYRTEVRKILIFRYLFGITPLSDRSILADINGKNPEEEICEPLGFNELSVSIVKHKDVMFTQSINNKWFKTNEKSIILDKMILYNKLGPVECFNTLRTNMCEIINRIDKNQISLESFIIEKINTILC